MERKFKVIVTSVQGVSGKVYGFPDEVSENDLPKGSITELIEGNYIEEVDEVKEKPTAKAKGE